MSETMRAWGCHDKQAGPCEGYCIVYARTRGQAAAIVVFELGAESIIDIVAHRKQDLDKYALKYMKTHIEDDPEIQREGLMYVPGETECQGCGLYPMDLDKYAVCEKCENCPECGHDDDCPEKELSDAKDKEATETDTR